MMRTGWNYNGKGRGVFECLHGLRSIRSQEYHIHHGIPKRHTRQFLRLAFLRAILDEKVADSVKEWRVDERVGLDSARVLSVSDKPCNPLDLTVYDHRWLKEQWNPIYADARFIKEVRFTANNKGWVVGVVYGFPNDPAGSQWWKLITPRHYSSTITIKRAIEKLGRITSKTPVDTQIEEP